MSTKICTTKAQSKKLLTLGLDANTADMYYGYLKDKPQVLPYADNEVKCLSVPAWSLPALLKLLGRYTLESNRNGKALCTTNGYYGGYAKDYDEPIDAVFEMVCWLLDNKKL